MNMLHQLWKPSERFNQIVPETDRVRRSEPDPLEAVDFLKRFEQLNKRTFAIHGGEFVPSVEIHYLTEQGHLLDTLLDQGLDLADDLLEWPASFVSSGERDNAKRAMHIAPLHNGDERSERPFAGKMVPIGVLRMLFFFDVDDGKPDIVKAWSPFSFDRLVHIFRDAMKFLGSDDQIKVRRVAQKRRSATLRHAPEKTVNDRTIAGEGAQHPHFSQGLLFGQVANTAGIQQNNVGFFFLDRDGMPPFHEHLSHLLRVTLVH